jgi:cation diffusion facilitator CzcD-associated flavoprotein CzcO
MSIETNHTETRRPIGWTTKGEPGHDTNAVESYECLIVGGGLHGIHVAVRLLEETAVRADQLRIVDTEAELAAAFREKANQCGMTSMRSSYLDHVGEHPLELEVFAAQRGRTDELYETEDYPPRPSSSLFLDHVDHVVDVHSLDDLHVRARVDGLTGATATDGVVVETDAGPLHAHHCILAVGQGDRYTRPPWTSSLDASAVDHVWDHSFDRDVAGRAVVVGGGVTAVQTALVLTESATEVTILARNGLTERTIEGDQRWQRWDHVEAELHSLPPGSAARLRRVREGRYDGTVPSYLLRDLETAVSENDVTVVDGEVDDARQRRDSTARLVLDDGRRLCADHVVLATGFESPFDHRFVERVASTLRLARGHAGMPVLEDQTLAWKRHDDTSSPVYLTGALAAGTVGPFAGNIVGARMAADRIVDSLASAECRVSPVVVERSVGL